MLVHRVAVALLSILLVACGGKGESKEPPGSGADTPEGVVETMIASRKSGDYARTFDVIMKRDHALMVGIAYTTHGILAILGRDPEARDVLVTLERIEDEHGFDVDHDALLEVVRTATSVDDMRKFWDETLKGADLRAVFVELSKVEEGMQQLGEIVDVEREGSSATVTMSGFEEQKIPFVVVRKGETWYLDVEASTMKAAAVME